MTTQTTNVESISEAELNELLALPGSDNVISGEDNKTKKNILTNNTKEGDKILDDLSKNNGDDKKDDAAADDKKDDKGDKKDAPDPKKDGKEKLDAEGNKILDETIETEEEEEEDENNAGGTENKSGKGRPNALIAVVGELIKSGSFLPLEGDKKIEDYTQQDALDLIESNFAAKEEAFKDELPKQFFESLSPQLKYLADFEYNGGKNLAPILKALLRVEEARALDPEVEKDQEQIVRKWLSVTEFGTEEEIDQEITALKDRSELDKKAKQFKPKLDSKEQEQIKQNVARQEEIKKLQQTATENYIKSVATVLQADELNGIKIDKKVKTMLFAGLTSPQYPAMNGGNTNLLGHLLELHQVHEPNHALIAEVLWLLSDPEEYKAKVRESSTKKTGEKVFKALKNAEKDKDSGSQASIENDDTKLTKKQGTVKRRSFLARP